MVGPRNVTKLILSPPPQFQFGGATSVVVSELFLLFYPAAPFTPIAKMAFLERMGPFMLIFNGLLLGATTPLFCANNSK